MRISTRGLYGLQALVDMALHANGDSMALYNIASRQGISLKYLEQVFTLLRKAEIVKSVKGKQGGYFLAVKPKKLTAGMILRALEGEFSVVDENTPAPPKDSIPGVLKEALWDKVSLELNKVMDSVTLEDLANEYKQRNMETTTMYYI